MPQMAPMFWLTLFILFNLLIMLTMNLMYFTTQKMPSSTATQIESTGMNWQW